MTTSKPTVKLRPRKSSGTLYETTLHGGRIEIQRNTVRWAYCTKSAEHYPKVSYTADQLDEIDLPNCHCGAPMKFGYPVSVTRIDRTTTFDDRMARDLGIGGFRHVTSLERRFYRTRKAALNAVDRFTKKYSAKKYAGEVRKRNV